MLQVAFIIANAPCPPNSLIPVCLEKILGDAILLWQIHALPAEVEHICVITGNDHEKIARFIDDLKSKNDISDNVECCQSSNAVRSILDLSATIGIAPTSRVLLLMPAQPLISPSALKELASDTGALVSAEQSDNLPGPISLHCAELQSAIKQLVQQTAEPSWDDLLKHISKTIQLKTLKCDREDLLHAQTRHNLSEIQSIARSRILNHWLCSGVVFMDSASAIVGPRVELAGRGVIIEPQVRLEGKITVGEGSTIGQGSVIKNSLLGANVEIR
ncbi:MAG: hypothetical protein LBH03_01310, partial [Holophagales bacterium]|nr:hypothetical protein [Holophagales bacterium]